jgi:LAO/AO transport system kinase
MWKELAAQIQNGDPRAIARAISLVENEAAGYEEVLQLLSLNSSATIIGVTGSPGSGKSTLVDGVIGELVNKGKKVAVICIDPSSPFNLGAVLGDRIRMSDWYLDPRVFIRSLATRGALGGLSPKIIEVTDIMKAAGFDHVIVETVGVGQSEVEIAGLADITVVVLVPEAGDEVQTMKAGLMEIADIFVVNKSDRPDADMFVKNLRQMLAPVFSKHHDVPVIKTIASEKKGIDELMGAINNIGTHDNDLKLWLLADKAWQLLVKTRMRDISKPELQKRLQLEIKNKNFNLYAFVNSIA